MHVRGYWEVHLCNMKIVILSPSIYLRGGVERFCISLTEGLSSRGMNVFVVGLETLPRRHQRFVGLCKYIGLGPVVLGFFLGWYVRGLQVDMVITNGLLGWNITSIPTINVSHGTYARAAERIDKKKNLIRFYIKKYISGYFEKKNALNARVAVAVSEETQESLRALYGISNSIVIQNGVDTNFFCPDSSVKKKPLQGLFVGRYEYAKGSDVLESVQKFLRDKGGDLYIAEHENQVDLLRLYRESSFFILPSRHEGCSFALLEAMACGLPVFVSPVGSVNDVDFPCTNCVVCDRFVYCEKVREFLNQNNSNLYLISKRLRSYVCDRHSLEYMTEQYYNIIRRYI